MSVNRSTPTVPSNQRGVGGAYNYLMVDRMALECAGYGADAAVRARLWNSSGTALARSASTTIAGVSTATTDLSLKTFDFTSPVALPGATLHRWGLWSTSAIAVQRVNDSNFNIWTDISIGAADDWSTGNTDVHAAGSNSGFVGYFRYYLMPTPPSVSYNGQTTSSVSFSWSVSDNGGQSISGYAIDYKPSWSSSWISYSTNYTSGTSATIPGLSSSTVYNVRVAAKNAVTDLVGTTSDYGYVDIQTDQDSTPPPTTTTVPNLNGLTLSQANSAISNAGLSSSANPQSSGATAENNNTVVTNSQSPSSGSVVNTGTTVSFSYYSYTPPVGPPYEVSVWNGTSWVASTPRIWNGTSWVQPGVVKVWNGTSWVDPT